MRDALLGVVTNKALQARANVRKTVTSYRLDMASAKAKDQEAEKLKAEIENIRIKNYKERMESISSFLKLALTIGTGYGFALVFLYCFHIARFFPSGFSVGDTALLLFVAIGFGIAAFVIATLGFMPFAPWVTVQGIQEEALSAPSAPPPPSTSFWLDKAAGICFSLSWVSAIVSAWAGSKGWFFLLQTEVKPPPTSDSPTIYPIIVAAFVVLALELVSLWLLFERQRVTKSPVRTTREHIKASWLDYLSNIFTWLVGISVWGGVGGAMLLLDEGLAYVLAALLGGFSIALSLVTLDGANAHSIDPERKKTRLKLSAFFAASAFILPPAFSLDLSTSALKQFVMNNLGIYSDRSALWVSAENLATLQSTAQLLNSPLSVCRNPDGSAVVTDLRIWWHGIGSRTYAELLDLSPPIEMPKKIEKELSLSRRVELKSEGARLIQSANTRCTELGENLLFRSNSPTPDPSINPTERICESLGPFIRLAAPTQEDGLHISRIEIVGHADPMAKKTSSNEQLGVERAKEIKKLILTTFRDSGKISDGGIIVPMTNGATSPLKDCTGIRDGALAKECNSINRRVQIRVHYARTKASTEASANLQDDPCNNDKKASKSDSSK